MPVIWYKGFIIFKGMQWCLQVDFFVKSRFIEGFVGLTTKRPVGFGSKRTNNRENTMVHAYEFSIYFLSSQVFCGFSAVTTSKTSKPFGLRKKMK